MFADADLDTALPSLVNASIRTPGRPVPAASRILDRAGGVHAGA
jgi:hypothetical protein